jgi:hypothetical protein
MNTLITGVSGSGKTTIAAELSRLGYDARNMDSVEGLCAWVDLSTGKPDPDFKIESADDWDGKYDWLWNEQRLSEIVDTTTDTYFCGSSGNQAKFFHMFGKIFLLEMDEQLIRDRVLNNERDHNYGRMPGEMDAIFGYFEKFQEEAITLGAIVIDAKLPVTQVVNLILAETIE